jgi:RHS repeat-associated protein
MDTMGRMIEFEYYPFDFDETTENMKPESGRLKTITDFSERKVEFTYDTDDKKNGDLLKVEFGNDEKKRIKKYEYKADNDKLELSHNLEKIIDPKGQTALCVNYTDDKVDSIIRGGENEVTGSKNTFSYDEGSQNAIVLDGNNNTKTYTHYESGHVNTVKEGTYSPTTFTYLTKDGKNEGLIKTVTYPEGNGITYGYYDAGENERRSAGNLVSITEIPDSARGDGGDPKSSTLFTYENYNNQITSIIYPNTLKITHDQFDRYGNVEKISTNIPGIGYEYTYNNEVPGQLESETTPWGATQYKYHSELNPGGKDMSTGGRELNPYTGGYLKDIISPLSQENFNYYDVRGNLSNYNNSMGVSASYAFNTFNELKRESVTASGSFSPLNYSAEYRKYDDNGNIEIKDTYFGTEGNQIYNNYIYTYTTRNMLASETESNRGTTFYGYDKNENLTNIIDPENKSVSFGYNALDLISSVTIGTEGVGSTYSYEYDSNGNMKKSIEPYGHDTFYEYDGYDRLQKVIDPLNNVTIISRAEFGNMLTIKRLNSAQELLRESITVNDPLGRMSSYTVKIPDGDDVTYTYSYSNGGKTIIITDSLGRISTVMKNEEGQVIKVIDAAGNIEEYFYEDGRGNMTRKVETEKTPDGTEETYETIYEYNAFNKIEKIIDPLGNETIFTYDVKGNLIGSKDAEGNIICHEYDNFGRKTKTIKHLGNGQEIETKFSYYKNNQLETIEDANGNMSRYEYDGQNRTKKIIYPDDTFIEYTYGSIEIEGENHPLVTIKQRNGTIVENQYDMMNRLWKRTITPSPEVEGTTFENYEYDGLSRVTKAENDFTTVEIQYDPLNRITQETQMGKLIKYTYQNLTENKTVRQTIQYPNQRIIERDFDLLNRISKIKEGTNDLVSYECIGRTYRLLNKQYNNGDVIHYLYDQGRRLTSKETRNKNSDLINKYVYGYNKVNMKTFEQRIHDSGKGDVFGYDDVYRLTNVKFNAPDPTILDTPQFEKSETYQFDKVDNIRKIIETQNQTVNEITTTMEGDNAKLNQYTTFDQWGLDYDLNGNMSQKGVQRFYYDYRNQLVRVVDGTTNTHLKYDTFGRRIEKTTGSDTVKYYYDGTQVIEERDGSDVVKRQLIYGNGIDELLIIVNYEGATAIPYYVHTNEIGSTTAITNQDGYIIERVSYDTFGMPTFTDYQTDPQNPIIVGSSVIGNDILFQGRRYDKETNLMYFRARYFEPIMGRFLQTDPMGYKDSMNLYQAFNMNPMNFLDPLGLWKRKGDWSAGRAYVKREKGDTLQELARLITRDPNDWVLVANQNGKKVNVLPLIIKFSNDVRKNIVKVAINARQTIRLRFTTGTFNSKILKLADENKINSLFDRNTPIHYSDCANAALIIRAKGIINSLNPGEFDALGLTPILVPIIRVHKYDWKLKKYVSHSKDISDVEEGDQTYFENKGDYVKRFSHAGMEGEHVIKVGDDLYYGFGFEDNAPNEKSIRSYEEWKQELASDYNSLLGQGIQPITKNDFIGYWGFIIKVNFFELAQMIFDLRNYRK